MSPISSCVLILGLNKCSGLLLRIQEQLLGQVVQFIVDAPQNTDHITAFTLCCMQSRITDPVYLQMLTQRVIYTDMCFMPYRILVRYLFNDYTFNQKHESKIQLLYDSSDYNMTVHKFAENFSTLSQSDRTLHIVAKLISLLFEYDQNTDLQQQAVYKLIVDYIFDEQYGLLSSIQKFDSTITYTTTNDLHYDTRSQLLINLAGVCNNPTDSNQLINFVNYYLIHLARLFPLSLKVAVGKFLEATFVSSQQRCKELFYKYLMLNSIHFVNAELFSYCFAHLSNNQKNAEFVEFMVQNLELFQDRIDCNLLLSSFDLKSYQIQINVCKYLKSRNYYLDSLIVSKVLKKNCASYYDGLVRRNALLRVLYDFDYITYEGLLPLMHQATKVNLITPCYYVQNLASLAIQENQMHQCPLSNILKPQVYAFGMQLPLLQINTEELKVVHSFGVIDGDKDSNYYSSLNIKYFNDVRTINNQVTILAADLFMKRKCLKFDFICNLQQVSQLQMLLGDEVVQHLPQIKIQEAVQYLQQDLNQFSQMQKVLAPRFSSSVTRVFLNQQNSNINIGSYSAIQDYLPPQQDNAYIQFDRGFELFNIMQMSQLQKSEQKQEEQKLVDAQHHTQTLNWASPECVFSSYAIHLALQTIYADMKQNKLQYQADDQQLNNLIEPVLTIIEQFSLNYIMRAETDLYRFFELIPLTSLEVLYLSVKIIESFCILFGNKYKKESKFSLLENIYTKIATALVNLIQIDDVQFELLSYDGHIVKFYYNQKYNKPLQGTALQKQKVIKSVGLRLACKFAQFGFGSSTQRVVLKHTSSLFKLEYPLILQMVFYSISAQEPIEFVSEKLSILKQENHIDMINKYAQYVLANVELKNDLVVQTIQFYTRVFESKLDFVYTDPVFASIVQEMVKVEPKSGLLALTPYLTNIDKRNILDHHKTMVSFVSEQKHALHSLPGFEAMNQQLMKLMLACPDQQQNFDIKSQKIDDALIILKQQIEQNIQISTEDLTYIINNIAETQLTISDIASMFTTFTDTNLLAVHNILSGIQYTSRTQVKQLVFTSLIFGIHNFQDVYAKVPFTIKQEQLNQFEAATFEANFDDVQFDNFGNEDFQPFDQNGFDEFQGKNNDQPQNDAFEPQTENFEAFQGQDTFEVQNEVQFNQDFDNVQFAEAQPIIVVTGINANLIIECLDLILPLLTAIPVVAAEIFAGYLLNVNADMFQYAQTYLQLFQITEQQAQQLIINILSKLEHFDDWFYEAHMQMMHHVIQIMPHITNSLNTTQEQVDTLKRCQRGQYQKIQEDEIGLKFSFLKK
ncbi:Conserved_hypothetical protein [Hexamita inflata]|uniref:Uncharacterized protein n=1 Tax=Hexamita inflata TaxID=28002 RepID=A0AA86RT37_9EUKA|nr:Conserved hypothetical protein [Hexamita inflata]